MENVSDDNSESKKKCVEEDWEDCVFTTASTKWDLL